jgi:hypothetical protein
MLGRVRNHSTAGLVQVNTSQPIYRGCPYYQLIDEVAIVR